MPLFNRHPAETIPVAREEVPQRKSSLFGRRHSSISPTRKYGVRTATQPESSRRGLPHRKEDPSILAARERVVKAEKMEKEADFALIAARTAVREARAHIKMLEKEAKQEARLAKIKQTEAKSISKRGHGLGRKSYSHLSE
ncbi:hypothetical protein PZA11_007729 [Diplocarpon coronariae]